MYSREDVYRAVIPVGGLGTRLLPITKVLPKELLPVGRRPVIQYVVEEMRAARLEHICLVTGRKKTLIQEHFDHDPELVRRLQDRGRDDLLAELAYLESGLHLTYIRQSGPQGLADALTLAEHFVGEQPFVVALGDSIIHEPQTGTLLRRMIEEHVSKDAAATLAVQAVSPDGTRYGGLVCPIDPPGNETGTFAVADILDKPVANTAAPGWAIAARFVFSPAIFSAIRHTRPARGGETLLTDAVRTLLRQGKAVLAVCLTPQQKRHDIGSFGGYYRAFLEFALADPYFSEELRTGIENALARDPGWEGEEGC